MGTRPAEPGCGSWRATGRVGRRAPRSQARRNSRLWSSRTQRWAPRQRAPSCATTALWSKFKYLVFGRFRTTVRLRTLSRIYGAFAVNRSLDPLSLGHFTSFFPHLFATFSVLSPRFQKPAPRPRKTVRNGRETAAKRGSKTVSSQTHHLAVGREGFHL